MKIILERAKENYWKIRKVDHPLLQVIQGRYFLSDLLPHFVNLVDRESRAIEIEVVIRSEKDVNSKGK